MTINCKHCGQEGTIEQEAWDRAKAAMKEMAKELGREPDEMYFLCQNCAEKLATADRRQRAAPFN